MNCAILFILAYNSCLQPSPTTFSIPFLSLFGLKASLFSALFSAENPLFSAFVWFRAIVDGSVEGTKKRTLNRLIKSPYKVLYILLFQDKVLCLLEAKLLCPMTVFSVYYLSAIAACAAANLAIGTRNGEQDT